MALTQSARIPGPGPSWDEEVVPALRKRNVIPDHRGHALNYAQVSKQRAGHSPGGCPGCR